MIRILLLLALVAPAQARVARFGSPGLPFSCSQIRQAEETYGRAYLEAMGRLYGVTPKQRRQAIACLRKVG